MLFGKDAVCFGANLMKNTLNELSDWLVQKASSVLIAIVFIAIGLKLVSVFVKFMKRSFEKTKVEVSVAGFLTSAIRIIGYILVFVTAAAMVGVEVTSFVTILGTASMAIGLALQGALANLAGGVLILVLKPFTVGDYIIENEKNMEGTVISIDIFYTRLLTYDNKLVVIPNGILTNNSLVNVTNEKHRKMEIKITIAYDSDMNKVKEVVYALLENDPRVIKDEPKDVFIDAFLDSGMSLGIRAWVNTSEYWNTVWDMRERLKAAFDEANIIIPYNRMDVTIHSDKNE